MGGFSGRIRRRARSRAVEIGRISNNVVELPLPQGIGHPGNIAGMNVEDALPVAPGERGLGLLHLHAAQPQPRHPRVETQ